MSKTGYFEHWEREHLGNSGKYSVFKSTIESYNKSIVDENYSLGFLISSSLLEDRIKSIWVLVEWKRRMSELHPSSRILRDTIPLDEIEDKSLPTSLHLESGKQVYRVKPSPTDVSQKSLESMVEDICKEEYISITLKDKTLYILEERNILTNLSMWNADRYSKDICEKFFTYFRRYDDIVREVKVLIDEK